MFQTRRMHHPGEQTKIHLNPDFISRGGRAPLNTKVHVNPAFLQKSQETIAAHNHVPPATALPTTTTTHTARGQHWQRSQASGTSIVATAHVTAARPRVSHGDTNRHVYLHSSKSVNGFPVSSGSHTRTSNLYTAPSTTKACDIYTKSSSTVPSSNNTKSHSLYSKSNIYNPYFSKGFPTHTKGLPQTQNIVAKKVAPEKHSPSYSWKASSSKIWTSSTQSDPSTSVDMRAKASLIKHPEFVTQQYTYPNPATKYSSVNKSFINTTVTRRIGTSQKITHHNENQAAASHSSLQSVSYKSKNIPHSSTSSVPISGNMNPVKISPKKLSAEENCRRVVKTKTQTMAAAGQSSSGKVVESKCRSLPVSKSKADRATYEPRPQCSGGTATESEPSLLKSVASKHNMSKSIDASVGQSLSSGTATKATQLTPNQKWVSKNKLVNSYKKPIHTKASDLNNLSNPGTLKTPRQKGNYKIITKTKLVKTNSNSTSKNKVQQKTAMEGQSVAQDSKTTHHISPRVTRTLKLSPGLRTHHTSTRLNSKKRYSVLSRTKLIRSQNQAGKGATSGKPKYSVITKNKLVRRRSSSGSSKSVSKAKTSKPETEKQRKFHVLSKTKIVRRRSSSGVYKVASTSSSSSSNMVTTPALHRKRAIVKRHKLVRNISSATAKQDTYKLNRRSFPKRVNTAFKVINTSTKMSTKQRLAKGIVSKYKINRLKVDSRNFRKHQKYFDYSSKARQKSKYKFQNKEG